MDNHCRVCGRIKGGYRITSMQRRILKYLAPQCNFDSHQLIVCHPCGHSILKHQPAVVANRVRKKAASIIVWNDETSEPVCTENGVPLRTYLSSNRGPDGRYRVAGSSPEPNELALDSSEPNVSIDQPSDQIEVSGPTDQAASSEPNVSIDQPSGQIEVSGPTDQALNTAKAYVMKTPRHGSGRLRRLTDKEKLERLEFQVQQKQFEGLKEIQTNIGRGISATRPFKRKEFVCTYHGDTISEKKGKIREKKYKKQKKGCFMYHFKFKGKTLIVDATSEKSNFGLGRLINHRKRDANIKPELIVINEKPYIYFWALKDIEQNSELFYNYNDLKCNIPWMYI